MEFHKCKYARIGFLNLHSYFKIVEGFFLNNQDSTQILVSYLLICMLFYYLNIFQTVLLLTINLSSRIITNWHLQIISNIYFPGLKFHTNILRLSIHTRNCHVCFHLKLLCPGKKIVKQLSQIYRQEMSN